METRVIIGIFAALLAIVSIGIFVYNFLIPKEQTGLRSLMGRGDGARSFGKGSAKRQGSGEELTQAQINQIKMKSAESSGKAQKLTLAERFFQAGMFSPDSQAEFYRMRILLPCVCGPLGGIAGFYYLSETFALVFFLFGVLVGLQAPYSILQRRIFRQGENIMYYLPLVIEQVSIGVSSSLDVGPCLSRIVSMADERDTHNAVTELLRITQFYVKSGVSLEEALMEVGKRSGHTELKHTFMSLSQVAKHGGEITRQLHELADSVSSQRETKIEAKIKKLELEATGPVALVFLGFLVIILIGFGIQIKDAFG